MLLYGIVWVSLILAYITEVRHTPVIGRDDTPAAQTASAAATKGIPAA
jgi:NNP family nitrate/nitrite transporter-like MFS transporter